MRQLGNLPRSLNVQLLGDYLLSIGIATRINESPDSWSVWVVNDDHREPAKREFEAFLQSPDDPKYKHSRATADAVRKEEERRNREYQRNVVNANRSWNTQSIRRTPLTSALVAVCVALFAAGVFSRPINIWLLEHLCFFPRQAVGPTHDYAKGLQWIIHGEVWRLWTPALLHSNILHLLFNMWALSSIGSLIEARKGTRFLAILVFFSALTSNVGQYLYTINFDGAIIPWVGISGVVYALFGYIWMKGRNEPEEGMMLHPSSVQTMLFWLVLGFFGFRFANGAHLVGLIVGMLVGLARF